MGRSVNISSLSSIIKYIQQTLMTLSIKKDKQPSKFQKVINSLTGFFTTIFAYLPHIPDFDVRFHIVFLSVFLLIFLDIILIWFSGKFRDSVFHCIDITVFFVLFFSISFITVSHTSSILLIILMSLSGIWLLFRIYWVIKFWNKYILKNNDLPTIIDQIKDHYLHEIVHSIQDPLNEAHLNFMLTQYNKALVINPVYLTFGKGIFGFIIFGISIIMILYGFHVFTPNVNDFIGVFSIIIGFLLALIVITVMLFITVSSFYEAFIKFRKFVGHYGLKIVMILLDWLYIPIGTGFLENFRFSSKGCPTDSYVFFENNNNYGFLDNLLNKTTQCIPCSNSYSNMSSGDQCHFKCSGVQQFYSTESPNLLFFNDILLTTGPTLFFSSVFFLIGLPLFWTYIVFHNKAIAWSIPAFGETQNDKWTMISIKLSSSGLYLFDMYKCNFYVWPIVVSVSKLIVIVLTEIATRFWDYSAYIVIIIYLSLFVFTIYFRPYLSSFNNILDAFIYGASTLLTILPILAIYNITLPDVLSIPFLIVLFVIPFIAAIYNFFFREKSLDPILDPAPAYDEDGNLIKGIEDESVIEISMIQLFAIWQLSEMEENKKIVGADEQENPSFYVDESVLVRHNVLMQTFEDMYKLIDFVMDSSTTVEIMRVLSVVILIAASSGGWFFGSIFAKSFIGNVTC